MTSTMPVNMIDNVQQDLSKRDDAMGRLKSKSGLMMIAEYFRVESRGPQ